MTARSRTPEPLHRCSFATISRQMLKGGLGPRNEGTWSPDLPCKQRGTISGFLSISTVSQRCFWQTGMGRLETGRPIRERRPADNVNNTEAAWMHVGYGPRSARNMGLGRPPAVSLGKGHFYLLHVRQNLCQPPRTPPQV